MTNQTIPCRCLDCGAIIYTTIEDVPERERGLPYPETCCDACLAAIREEMAHADYTEHHRPRTTAKALIAAALLALTLTSPVAARDHRDSQIRHDDPSLALVMQIQASKYPAPHGCAVVGVWDDGSIVGYCDDGARDGLDAADTWLSHGPAPWDVWQEYSGPKMTDWTPTEMRHHKGNEHHMIRDDTPDPSHDPPGFCESCGWRPEENDPDDFIYAAEPAWVDFGQWLCMECE